MSAGGGVDGVCHCGTLLAGPVAGRSCPACNGTTPPAAATARSARRPSRTGARRSTSDLPTDLPASFWNEPALREAFAHRHMGRVIRAWRTHRFHPRPVPQERVAEWAAMTQPQLSRIENGPPIKNLDRLTHFATLLRIPPGLLWFDLPPGRAVEYVALAPSPRPEPVGGGLGIGPGGNRSVVATPPAPARSPGRPVVPSPVRGSPELRAPIDPARLSLALGRRHLQVALDVSDLDEAARLAEVAAATGADLIEVGDPLLKPFGMQAVREIRAVVPGMPLVVEFSSSDWIDEQIALAVEAGADLVLVMGVDQASRIERAVHAARTKRVGILLAVPSQVDVAQWCSTVENTGADGISIIRNIDSAESAVTTGSRLREVSRLSSVPLAVSGGFSPHNVGEVLGDRWSILIVGGAYVRARQPAEVLRSLRRSVDAAA